MQIHDKNYNINHTKQSCKLKINWMVSMKSVVTTEINGVNLEFVIWGLSCTTGLS